MNTARGALDNTYRHLYLQALLVYKMYMTLVKVQ